MQTALPTPDERFRSHAVPLRAPPINGNHKRGVADSISADSKPPSVDHYTHPCPIPLASVPAGDPLAQARSLPLKHRRSPAALVVQSALGNPSRAVRDFWGRRLDADESAARAQICD